LTDSSEAWYIAQAYAEKNRANALQAELANMTETMYSYKRSYEIQFARAERLQQQLDQINGEPR
jgi:hypothetical protein